MGIIDGRGRWYRWDKKSTVDDLLCLDISWVAKQIDLDLAGSGSFTWTRTGWAGESKSSIGYDAIPGVGLRLRYSHNGESIDPYLARITYTTPNYGGKRPWFLCPNQKCGRRVRKLYGGKYYLCRHCQNLTYEVCQKSHREALQTTIANRMRAIQKKLGASGGLIDPLPEKPPTMQWGTYGKLVTEYEELQLLHSYSIVESMRGLLPDDATNIPALDVREVWQDIKRIRDDESQLWRTMVTRGPRPRYIWDDEEEQPKRVTLGELAKLAGVDYAFAQEAVREDLLRPDGGRGTRVKRYRRRLASWLQKLHLLREDGYSWDEIGNWTQRRWLVGHEEERDWPT